MWRPATCPAVARILRFSPFAGVPSWSLSFAHAARSFGTGRVKRPRAHPRRAACSAGAPTPRAASRTSTRIRRSPGHLIGFEVELAEALARELGVRAEFVQNDWSNLVPSLERGTFDVVMNGLEVTDGARRARALHAAVLRLRRAPDGARRTTRRSRATSTSLRRASASARSRTASRSRCCAGTADDRALRGRRGAVHRSRSTGAPTPCCSTTSSPTRYGVPKPELARRRRSCATATTRSPCARPSPT